MESAAPALPPQELSTPDTAALEGEPVVRPDEIYFELTAFEWYRRGEPLVHQDVAYRPAGTPMVAPAESMQPAGTYEGVRYYVREGSASADSLFVPVHQRYWLPFVPSR